MEKKRTEFDFFFDLFLLCIVNIIAFFFMGLIFRVFPWPVSAGLILPMVMFLMAMNFKFFKVLFDLPPYYGTVRGL